MGMSAIFYGIIAIVCFVNIGLLLLILTKYLTEKNHDDIS